MMNLDWGKEGVEKIYNSTGSLINSNVSAPFFMEAALMLLNMRDSPCPQAYHELLWFSDAR